MSSNQLADLAGYVALESMERARAGDTRRRSAIADDVLAEAAMPDLAPVLRRLARMIATRQRRAATPPRKTRT